jgi:hypothetical protein
MLFVTVCSAVENALADFVVFIEEIYGHFIQMTINLAAILFEWSLRLRLSDR